MATRNTRNVGRLALVLTIALAAAHHAAAQGYKFVDFDGLGDHAGGTTINGINNLGQEVGFSTNTGDATFTNFVRNADGTFTALNGTNGLLNTEQANGINNAGTVVGSNGDNGAFSFAKGGTPTNLALADPGNTTSQVAFGINDNGAIVGQYVNTDTGNTPGFLLSGGAFTLFTPTTNPATIVTNVQGINNNGIAVGFDSPNGTNQHGFVWNTGTNAATQIADPSTPRITVGGLVLTQFLGVNDNGTAVGYYQTTNGSQFGFLYSLTNSKYTYLDDSNAVPVNGVQITQITGIDNRGDLAGFSQDGNGIQHGFIATVAPESGSLALLLAPAALAVGITLRRRTRSA